MRKTWKEGRKSLGRLKEVSGLESLWPSLSKTARWCVGEGKLRSQKRRGQGRASRVWPGAPFQLWDARRLTAGPGRSTTNEVKYYTILLLLLGKHLKEPSPPRNCVGNKCMDGSWKALGNLLVTIITCHPHQQITKIILSIEAISWSRKYMFNTGKILSGLTAQWLLQVAAAPDLWGFHSFRWQTHLEASSVLDIQTWAERHGASIPELCWPFGSHNYNFKLELSKVQLDESFTPISMNSL